MYNPPHPNSLACEACFGDISLQETMGYRGTNMVSDIFYCLLSVILISVT